MTTEPRPTRPAVGNLALITGTLTLADAPASTVTPAPPFTLEPVISVSPSATAPLSSTTSPALSPALSPIITPSPVSDDASTPKPLSGPADVPSPTPTAALTVSVQPAITVAPTVTATRQQIVDLGFRPKPNGYVFANYGGITPADYTISDMRRMFGDAAVCRNTACAPKPAAAAWNTLVNELMAGGHCDGFTLTALRFYKQISRPTAFQLNARQPFDLNTTTLRRTIAYYWVLQIPDPVASARNAAFDKRPSETLAQLRAALGGRAADPLNLVVYNDTATSGHSVLPYAIERAADTYFVRVYDSNWPGDLTRAVIITPTQETWSYDLGFGNLLWQGNAETRTMGVVPMSLYARRPACAWCAVTPGVGPARFLIAAYTPDTRLLATAQTGQQLDASTGRSDIPGAFAALVPGGLGQVDPPLAYLPVTSDYTLTLSAAPRSAPGLPQAASRLIEFGPNYVTTVNDLTLQPDRPSAIAIHDNGRQVVFESGAFDRTTFNLIVEQDAISQQLTVGSLGVGAGRTITLSFDTVGGQIIISNTQNLDTTYDLTYQRVTSDSAQLFTTYGVVITATDVQRLDVGAWPGTGPITLTIDSGSTGQISQTVPLYHQPYRWWVPFAAH